MKDIALLVQDIKLCNWLDTHVFHSGYTDYTWNKLFLQQTFPTYLLRLMCLMNMQWIMKERKEI